MLARFRQHRAPAMGGMRDASVADLERQGNAVTDPRNTYAAQAGARSAAAATTNAHADAIAKLKLPAHWKKRFELVEAAGGTEMPFLGDLDFEEMLLLYGNVKAFFFGPFYYYALGMRRQAAGFAACWAALVLLCWLDGAWGLLSPLGGILMCVSSIRANVSYYAKQVLHADRWL